MNTREFCTGHFTLPLGVEGAIPLYARGRAAMGGLLLGPDVCDSRSG
jgi:hypothetical protein